VPPKKDNRRRTFKKDKEEDPRAERIFGEWASKVWPHVHGDRKPKRTEKRLKPIRARLREGYTEEQFAYVLDRAAESRWHHGENDRGKPFIEPETLFRSAEKMDAWLGTKRPTVAARNGAGPKQPNYGIAADVEIMK